jgi:hypothetical protein
MIPTGRTVFIFWSKRADHVLTVTAWSSLQWAVLFFLYLQRYAWALFVLLAKRSNVCWHLEIRQVQENTEEVKFKRLIITSWYRVRRWCLFTRRKEKPRTQTQDIYEISRNEGGLEANTQTNVNMCSCLIARVHDEIIIHRKIINAPNKQIKIILVEHPCQHPKTPRLKHTELMLCFLQRRWSTGC